MTPGTPLDAYGRSRAAWPRVDLPRAAFDEALGGAVAEGLRVEDLYLAVACARGVEGAAEELERAFIAPTVSALRSRERDAEVADEIAQRLRVRLLVGEGERPARIAEYQGRGGLGSWIRVVAARLQADLHRRGRREVALDDEAELTALAAGVDLVASSNEHREAVAKALHEALSGLSKRERMLLRLHHVEGLPLDRIGAIYGVDKATISRRLKALRCKVADEAMARLAEATGASFDEARSLFALLASSLDLSLRGALGSALDAPRP